MRRYERLIKIAFDEISKKILDADEVFDSTKNPFDIRKKYHEQNIILSCCECGQDLMISSSRYDRLYFKHKPGHDYCILADQVLTPQNHVKFTEILKGKESNRHKELKNKIGGLLKNESGIDVNSIQIDNSFIIKENERRKPDVYCKFLDKELVFEIQLSDLSLGYILSRYNFYKKHGIYLIWILDNFDKQNQGTLERDIKYLTKYENFFKLDENAQTLKLLCDYKFPFLNNNNDFFTKWIEKSVALNDLKFDNKGFQIYYYNFGDNKVKIETLQKQKKKETEKINYEKTKLENAKNKAKNLITKINAFKTNSPLNFDEISNELNDFSDFELEILNKKLNLNDKIKPPLIVWIDKANQGDTLFLRFILKNIANFELDLNKTDKGRTPLQALLEKENIYKYSIALLLFEAGYRLTESDNLKLSELKEEQKITESDFYTFKFCNNLLNRNLVSDVDKFKKQLFIIESAKEEKLICYNFKNGNIWISFANNAIEHYGEYWEYIELAFNRFGLWDKLIELDTNGTFQQKLEKFYSKIPQQKYDFDDVFKDLYPEIQFV